MHPTPFTYTLSHTHSLDTWTHSLGIEVTLSLYLLLSESFLWWKTSGHAHHSTGRQVRISQLYTHTHTHTTLLKSIVLLVLLGRGFGIVGKCVPIDSRGRERLGLREN